jgi:gas vesicle protein
MAWELLPVDYTDAVWAGLKRYNQINNEDGSVSFQDITAYTGKEKSFFGAKDANRMNEALNTIMSMVENGTDLYTAFQNYFADQKTLFEQEADSKATEFDNYTDNLEQEYKASMAAFESQQQQIYNAWFQAMKDQLSKDAAGNLQNQCTELDERLTLLEQMTMQNDFSAPLATDDEAITLIVDDLDYAILADWKYKEE